MKAYKFSVMIFLVMVASPVFAGQVINLATLAPEGTTFYNAIVQLNSELKQRTGGAVQIQLYAGGVAGDEADVVRKLRVGQVNAAGFTGVGLGMILPEIRVLELPMAFTSYDEVDRVYAAMRSHFERAFADKGYIMLGWADVGFVNIFSNTPIKSKQDLQGVKMWMWEGDKLAQTMFEVLQIVPVPLAITDVMTSLQTGLINAAYAPPLAAIAFQWHTKTKYVTDIPLVNAVGSVLVTKAVWDKLGAAHQAVLKELGGKYTREIVAKTRQENAQSLQVLASSGLTVVKLTPESETEIRTASKEVESRLVGTLYSQELLNQFHQALGH